MDDLRDRLHQVESNPLPDVWDDVLDRATRHGIEERPSAKRRVLIGTMALLIAALAFAVSLPALRGPGTTDKGLLPASQDGAVQITISGDENTAATMSSGGTSVAGVPVDVVSAGRADGTVTHGPTYEGTIGGTLQMNSFHFDYAAVAAPDLTSISVASDATIASDPAETVVFAFAPPADQTGPPHWSPTGEGRMIPLQLPSSVQHLSEGPWRLVVVGRGSSGNLFQFAFQVDVQAAEPGVHEIPANEVVQQMIVIRPGVDGTGPVVFAPPPVDGIDEALTAAEALQAFKVVDPQYTAADGATPLLGSYTAPSGPDTYRFQDHLAWAFKTTTTCPPSPNPNDSQSPSGECTDWLFLDARTGKMLEATFVPTR